MTLWGFCVGSVLGGILWDYIGRVLVEKGTQTLKVQMIYVESNTSKKKPKTTTNPNQPTKQTKKTKKKILESKGEKLHGFSEELRLWVAFDFHLTRFFLFLGRLIENTSGGVAYLIAKRFLPSSGRKPQSTSWKPGGLEPGQRNPWPGLGKPS